MYIFKFVFKLFVFASALVGDSSGWYPVEQPRKAEINRDEDDPSIWALFAKKMGEERFLVRFPDDPAYSYPSPGILKISSVREGEQFTLWVEKKEAIQGGYEERVQELGSQEDISLLTVGEDTRDIMYRKEGKWVREHLVESASHLFLFQTVSPEFSEKNHQYFVQSLSFE